MSLSGGASMTGTDNGGVSVSDGKGLSGIFSGIEVETVKGVLKDYFGLETGDLKRAIGSYLLSRAAGSSHNGAMRYAGETTYSGIERREDQELKEQERDELWARQDQIREEGWAREDRIRAENQAASAKKAVIDNYSSNSGNYTVEGNEQITKLLNEGKIVEAQVLMNDASLQTDRAKLGIEPNATGEFWVQPGYTTAKEVFAGAGGRRFFKGADGSWKEITNPGAWRKRNQDDDVTSLTASVRAHVNTFDDDLFADAKYDRDSGDLTKPAGIFAGRSKAGVVDDIMAISQKNRGKGLPDDPREIMRMITSGAELTTSMGVKKISAETIYDMQVIGGDTLFDTTKLTKTDGKLVDGAEARKFTSTVQQIAGSPQQAAAVVDKAAQVYTTDLTMGNILASTNYANLSDSQKSKVANAPTPFMALVYIQAYANS